MVADFSILAWADWRRLVNACKRILRTIDQAGPMRFVNFLLTALLQLVPIAVGAAAGVVAHSVITGIVAAAIVALAECLPLLSFAAMRLSGNVDVFSSV